MHDAANTDSPSLAMASVKWLTRRLLHVSVNWANLFSGWIYKCFLVAAAMFWLGIEFTGVSNTRQFSGQTVLHVPASPQHFRQPGQSRMASRGATWTIWVAVHRGDPVDMAQHRHTALWCEPDDGGAHYYFHATDTRTGRFAFERRDNFVPDDSRTFAGKARVGPTGQRLGASELCGIMGAVPVTPHDPEFGCQMWVGLAMGALLEGGIVTRRQYDAGLDGMSELILQAEVDCAVQFGL